MAGAFSAQEKNGTFTIRALIQPFMCRITLVTRGGSTTDVALQTNGSGMVSGFFISFRFSINFYFNNFEILLFS